ncbi:MAG: competence/damage-inducible protein A [Candidatus Aphodosoma sp.]
MKTHIINIGDELLIGQVVNTNASWMAEELNKCNISVTNISVISDGEDDIIRHLDLSLAETDVVLITGGLGPTKDDITKTVLCRYFNDELVTHIPTLENVRRFFERRGLPFTDINKAQALVPSRCKVVLNEVGTAPCMVFDHEGKTIVSMPGVPFEMKWLMTNHILPMLCAKLGSEAIVHRTVLTFGIGESFLADRIASWEDALPSYIRLAYLPEAGKVRLRLSAYGSDHLQLQCEVEKRIGQLHDIIPDNIYGYDDDTVQSVVGRLLAGRHATLATAESCTGGLVANTIVSVPGASEYFVGGIVAYDNRIKISQLGVPEGILGRHGAVSEETALAMARGCLAVFGVDYAIATTGISGPGGGTADKPQGTVYIAVASSAGKAVCRRYVFQTIRTEHQCRTANQALFDLWQMLK